MVTEARPLLIYTIRRPLGDKWPLAPGAGAEFEKQEGQILAIWG